MKIFLYDILRIFTFESHLSNVIKVCWKRLNENKNLTWLWFDIASLPLINYAAFTTSNWTVQQTADVMCMICAQMILVWLMISISIFFYKWKFVPMVEQVIEQFSMFQYPIYYFIVCRMKQCSATYWLLFSVKVTKNNKYSNG